MSLQDLVITRLAELGISARTAAKRSRGGVSYDTLYAIARGEHSGDLRDTTVQGIAGALNLPPGEVYDAAGLPRPVGRWQPPASLDRLSLAQRRLLEDVGSALLDADRRGYERGRRAE